MAPWASRLAHLGYTLIFFWHFGGPRGFHLATLGLHLGTLGLHFGALLALWGVALDPFGHFGGKGAKNVLKITENGTLGERFLRHFL